MAREPQAEAQAEVSRGRTLWVDAATYAALVSLYNDGLCSSISECVRKLVKVASPKVYAHEIYELLERAKAVAKAAGCERCTWILEIARVVVLRLLSGHEPPCKLLEELVGVVCGDAHKG